LKEGKDEASDEGGLGGAGADGGCHLGGECVGIYGVELTEFSRGALKLKVEGNGLLVVAEALLIKINDVDRRNNGNL
jgi:hypothetical protein